MRHFLVGATAVFVFYILFSYRKSDILIFDRQLVFGILTGGASASAKPKNVIEFLIESFGFGEIVSDYVDTKTKSTFIVQ